MHKLKNTINNTLLDLIKKSNRKIIYLDYPIHFNIGDLAIYHGTETFFKENKIEILERFNIHNLSYSRIRKLIKEYGNILFLWHGGGNMGDTYLEKAENKRRKFIKEFSEQKIFFLPQSIFYKDEINLKNSIEFYNNSNITLFVRDNASFKLIKENYPLANNYLCPDMAYYLADSKYLKSFSNIQDLKDKIVIARIDEEKIGDILGKETDEKIDWLLMTGLEIKIKGYIVAGILMVLGKMNLNSDFLTNYWYITSLKLLSKGFDLISKYKHIETDRLHGFIMSNLLNKEITTSDNYYGKINNYRSTWKI